MKYRLEEGGGEAVYILGVADNGEARGIPRAELDESLQNLSKVAKLVNATATPIRISQVKDGLFAAEVLVRVFKEKLPIIVSVAVLGHVNAGKSTLIGALISGKRDDGSGSLRNLVARYLHEVISGRTSSVSARLLGYDERGEPISHKLRDPLDEMDVTMRSSKVVKLIDLAGHEKYLRTTLKGLLGYSADYVMLVVGTDDGLSIMGKEHLGIASVLKLPIFIVVTKVDKYGEERVRQIISEIKGVLKLPGVNRLPFEVDNEEDIYNAMISMKTLRVVPLFKVSAVTGDGMTVLTKFLNLLPPRRVSHPDRFGGDQRLLAYIDEIYDVTGVGTVVLATVFRGTLNQNQKVYIGPDELGQFREARVKTIQVNKIFVERVKARVVATFAIQGLHRKDLRKGMAVLDTPGKGMKEFRARVFLLHHPTTIKKGYVATFHTSTIRQAVRFKEIGDGYLRTGDSAEITLEFLYRPEYLEDGQLFVFREGRTRGIGTVKLPN